MVRFVRKQRAAVVQWNRVIGSSNESADYCWAETMAVMHRNVGLIVLGEELCFDHYGQYLCTKLYSNHSPQPSPSIYTVLNMCVFFVNGLHKNCGQLAKWICRFLSISFISEFVSLDLDGIQSFFSCIYGTMPSKATGCLEDLLMGFPGSNLSNRYTILKTSLLDKRILHTVCV